MLSCNSNTSSEQAPVIFPTISKPSNKFYPNEPDVKRATVFIDGQNLLYSLRHAFGVRYPNYDPRKLAEEFCKKNGYELHAVRFYTGTETEQSNKFWYDFWKKKIDTMKQEGVITYTRPLQYRRVPDRDDPSKQVMVPMEKGVDIRIALDIVQELQMRESNVMVVFSQDSDFCELSSEIRNIARKQGRWIKFVSAYPKGKDDIYSRGINGSDWAPFDAEFYRNCIDRRDYRPQNYQQ